jgi:UDP-glucose 4-epimerase
MKVLVTGGAGHIGSHAVRALQKAGHPPMALDNLSHGHRAIAVDQQLSDHAIEAMLHLADFTGVGETVSDPSRYCANKVAGSLALLRALVGAGRERGTAPPTIVFSSTAATYGVPQQQLISEDHRADQPLWRWQTGDGAHAGGLRPRLWPAQRVLPLLQRRPRRDRS